MEPVVRAAISSESRYGRFLTQACLASARAYAAGADDKDVRFFSDAVTDAQAIVFAARVDEAAKPVAVVAFRGSTSTSDWLGNALVPMVRVPGHSRKVRAHSGFLRQYISLDAAIRSAVQSMDVSGVVFCGHSLGGALACVACSVWPVGCAAGCAGGGTDGATLPENQLPCRLATFGAPRAGNAEFASVVRANTDGNVFRIVHDLDIVPSIPMRIMSYCHVAAPWIAVDHRGFARCEPEERTLREELILRAWGVLATDFGVSDHFMSRYLRACSIVDPDAVSKDETDADPKADSNADSNAEVDAGSKGSADASAAPDVEGSEPAAKGGDDENGRGAGDEASDRVEVDDEQSAQDGSEPVEGEGASGTRDKTGHGQPRALARKPAIRKRSAPVSAASTHANASEA